MAEPEILLCSGRALLPQLANTMQRTGGLTKLMQRVIYRAVIGAESNRALECSATTTVAWGLIFTACLSATDEWPGEVLCEPALPFLDRELDVLVICDIGVLEEREALFDEAKRVLRDTGFFLLSGSSDDVTDPGEPAAEHALSCAGWEVRHRWDLPSAREFCWYAGTARAPEPAPLAFAPPASAAAYAAGGGSSGSGGGGSGAVIPDERSLDHILSCLDAWPAASKAESLTRPATRPPPARAPLPFAMPPPVPGEPARPTPERLPSFYDDWRALFPELEALRAAAPQLLAEALAARGAGNFRDWPEQHNRDGGANDWTVLPFLHTFPAHDRSAMTWIEPNCARCPRTAAMLRALPTIRTALFSKLGPGTHLSNHTGWAELANHVLRCHIGLRIPAAVAAAPASAAPAAVAIAVAMPAERPPALATATALSAAEAAEGSAGGLDEDEDEDDEDEDDVERSGGQHAHEYVGGGGGGGVRACGVWCDEEVRFHGEGEVLVFDDSKVGCSEPV